MYRRGVQVAVQALAAHATRSIGAKAAQGVKATAAVTPVLAAASWGITRGFAADTSKPVTLEEAEKILEEKYEHATGMEKEELLAQIMGGKPRFETGPPVGPFGTVGKRAKADPTIQDAPAIIEAEYDERIVGCSGGYFEDEHDVIWFNLTKDAPFTCPDCGQVFKLKVIGEGGKPGGH